MKKVFFASSMFVFVVTGLSACGDCEVCTKDSEPEVRICEDDYSTNVEYSLALDAREANGYTCIL